MSRTAIASIVALGATVADAPPPGALPWVHGLGDVRLGSLVPSAPEPPEGCGVGAIQTWVVRANVAAAEGTETISASFLDGVTVRDHGGRVLGRLPGSPCEGSADEIVTLAVARLDGAPVVVVATVRGGRSEAATEVAFYRPGPAHVLDAVFVAVVETWDDDIHAEGAIWLRENRLFFQPPAGGTYEFTFDPVGRSYVPNGRIDRIVVPHVPPDV